MIADGAAARATSRGAQRRDEARSGGLGVDGGGERRVNSSRRLAGIDEGAVVGVCLPGARGHLRPLATSSQVIALPMPAAPWAPIALPNLLRTLDTMDSFELNKILGAILGTCLGVLAINIAAGAIFAPLNPPKPGYDIVETNTLSAQITDAHE